MKTITHLLQRTTRSTNFIPEIDGLRFLAILTVVLFHFNAAYSRSVGVSDFGKRAMGGDASPMSLAWWILRLDLGVKVFFAISGFVLALPFLKVLLRIHRDVPLQDYYLRRLTRLEPPFIISMLGFTLVHLILLDTPNLPNHLMVGLLYAHVPVYGSMNPINPVTWSLETEAQFYVLVPVLFYVLKSPGSAAVRGSLLVALIVGSVLFRSYVMRHELSHFSNSILAYFSNFGVGILFAWLYIERKDWVSKKSWFWDVIGVAALFGVFWFYKPQARITNALMFNICIFLTLLVTFKGRSFNWAFTRPPVFLIGGMCYSIYLIHYAFLHLWVPLVSSLSTGMGYVAGLALQAAIGIPVVLVVCACFFVLCEKPFMDQTWRKKAWNWVVPQKV